MKKAFVFPGQGSQFSGMGKDLYDSSPTARALFDEADRILGFEISKIMFEGSAEELKQTKVTQPAVFIHSVAAALALGDEFCPAMVAGHSLGEFSALAASGALTFESALRLVFANRESKTILVVLTIVEVESQSLFGKYFKRVVGVSPRTYRQQIKRVEN